MTKVFLGMSGGVDSSTAAVLLREQGYTVHGLHLSLLRGLPLSTEHPVEDGAAAAAAAAQLGIPFHDADLSGQFREAVISYFVRTYQEGQTPNPCVVCNRRIKFGAMWDTARAMGADCLLTGEANHHHACDAKRLGLSLIAAGHYATEFPVTAAVAEKLRAALPGVEVLVSTANKDPYTYL